MNFLHPEFLYGLLALSVPIILHLFSFKKYKKVYFSNFSFLQSLQKQKKNSSRLKNLLLLLFRLLALSAIIIAFATPYLTPDHSNQNIQSESLITLYIDNSFSMSNNGSKGSLFEEAKKHLFDIVNFYPDGTSFTLFTNDTYESSLTKEQVITTLGSLQMTPGTKRLSEIFKETRNSGGGKHSTLFLISDFQKNICDFPVIAEDTLTNPIFLFLEAENKQNLYIKEVTQAHPLHKKNQNDKINITIVNQSDKDFNNIPVSLTINNKKKSVSKINLPGNSEKSVEIAYRNTEDEFYKGIVEISDFPVVFDNRFFFTYKTGGLVNILCIEENKHNLFFEKLFSDSTLFNLVYTNINKTASINFDNYNLVILDRPLSIRSGLENKLAAYVRGGGNLFMLPGSSPSVNTLNQLSQKINAPLLSSPDSNTVISHIETQAFLFRDAFEKEDAGDNLPNIKYFYRIAEKKHMEKLLADKKGNTLLASLNIAKGCVYLSSFDFAPENSNMVYHPLFVPLMVNMAYNLNQELDNSWFFNSEKSLMLHNKTYPENSRLRVINDDESFEFIPEIHKDLNGNSILANTQHLHKSGIYNITQDNRVIDLFACNYNRNESELQYSDIAEIQKYFPQSRVEEINTTEFTQNNKLVKEIVLQDNNKYLAVWFLFLALAALLAEQVIWRKKFM